MQTRKSMRHDAWGLLEGRWRVGLKRREKEKEVVGNSTLLQSARKVKEFSNGSSKEGKEDREWCKERAAERKFQEWPMALTTWTNQVRQRQRHNRTGRQRALGDGNSRQR